MLDDGRYHLRVPPERIDTHRFRAGDRRRPAPPPTRATPAGRARSSRRRARNGAGRPFEGFFGIAPVDAARERLERLRLDALCDYAAALLADDRADEVVRALEPVIDDHLTHEALAGQLMLGLFHCARQSDALQLFARVADCARRAPRRHAGTGAARDRRPHRHQAARGHGAMRPARRSTRFGAADRSTSSVAPRSSTRCRDAWAARGRRRTPARARRR